MSDNPYAPPQADLGGAAAAGDGSGDFEIGRCLSEAWEHTWANFPLWLGAGIVFTLAIVASAITILGLVLALPVLYWGAFAFTLRMHDRVARVGDLFTGFSNYGRVLGGMLGFYLLIVALGLPANAMVQIAIRQSPPNWPLAGVGYLASLAIAFLVTLRLLFAPFLMVDRDLGLGEALSQSWRRTSNLKAKVALLSLAMGAVNLVGVAALFVGVIPALVVGFLMWASAYRQIFGSAPQPAA